MSGYLGLMQTPRNLSGRQATGYQQRPPLGSDSAVPSGYGMVARIKETILENDDDFSEFPAFGYNLNGNDPRSTLAGIGDVTQSATPANIDATQMAATVNATPIIPIASTVSTTTSCSMCGACSPKTLLTGEKTISQYWTTCLPDGFKVGLGFLAALLIHKLAPNRTLTVGAVGLLALIAYKKLSETTK